MLVGCLLVLLALNRAPVLGAIDRGMGALFPRKPRVEIPFPEELQREADLTPEPLRGIADLGASSCRVVVVTSTTCAGSRKLAINWVANLLASSDSAGVGLHFGWIIFGPVASSLDPFELVQKGQTLPPVRSLQFSRATVRGWFGTSATPLTIIVDSSDTIRFARLSDRVPTSAELSTACSGTTIT